MPNEWSEKLTFAQVEELANKVFPNSSIDVDNEGQWVVYTDCLEVIDD